MEYYTWKTYDQIWHDESILSKKFYPKYAFGLDWITPKIESVRSFGKQNKLLLLILCKLTKKYFVLPNFCYVLVVYHNIIKLLVNFALWLLSRLLSRPSLYLCMCTKSYKGRYIFFSSKVVKLYIIDLMVYFHFRIVSKYISLLLKNDIFQIIVIHTI